MTKPFTLALPSKGAIAEPTYSFLKECGLKIYKPNPRQYIGAIPAIPSLGVLYQRVVDVVYKVADGTVQLGITGLDVVYEHPDENLVVIHDALGYGHCQLVIAVPEAWVDVENIHDLMDVVLDFREQKGRNIRVATKYTYSTREFFHRMGINHFDMVKADGAIEAAPTLGYADIIVDLVQTGTTLRENHLKQIEGGLIVDAQACLIGNRQALAESEELMEVVRAMTEFMDAYMNGREYYQISVDIRGVDAREVAAKVSENPVTHGLLGPTVAPIFQAGDKTDNDTSWHTVTLTVGQKKLLPAVEHLRSIGGKHALVTPVRYVFFDESPTYRKLVEKLALAEPTL